MRWHVLHHTMLETAYLGLRLRSPVVASASPLTYDSDNVKRLAEAGAGAIVFHSLFQEQIQYEQFLRPDAESEEPEQYPEALRFMEDRRFRTDPDEYCRRIAAVKADVQIPIIASLNASSRGGWSRFARRLEDAGADALELNFYELPTNLAMPGSAIEERFYEMFHNVKTEVKLPIAVKLGPFFSNFANVAKTFDDLGAQGLVLFNRFYQPDIELETREEAANIILSAPFAMRLPLRWTAILHGRVGADLAATSGIHSGIDALKMIMAGSAVTMVCSVLLEQGIQRLAGIEQEMREWMEEHDVTSLDDIRGVMSLQSRQNPTAFERGQYLAALIGWRN